MLAQVLLTPVESKKLIAKAIARMDHVRKAFNEGIIAIHPSTSTIFLVEELTGKLPDTKVWVCGVNSPRGANRTREVIEDLVADATGRARTDPPGFKYTWVLDKGQFRHGLALGDILGRMGPGDVYVKGVNAIDPQGTVGVLVGSKVGGTIGFVMREHKVRNFQIVFPVGLEKLIPVPMRQAAAAAAKRNSLSYCMGVPCTLLPCEGTAVSEIQAISILGAGAQAVPISSGGLAGAEGAVTLVVEGSDEQVTGAIAQIEKVKGAALPREVRVCEWDEDYYDGFRAPASRHGKQAPTGAAALRRTGSP